MTVRDEVLEHLVEVMRRAEEQGAEPMVAASRAYPGTPDTVLWTAWSRLEDSKTEAWWQSVEKTIDGEIIRQALLSTSTTEPVQPHGAPAHE